MNEIRRIGNSRRWADVVIYAGVARWVEVAEDAADDTSGQIEQVLRQIDATLEQIQSDRERLLEEKFQEALKRADKTSNIPFRNPLDMD